MRDKNTQYAIRLAKTIIKHANDTELEYLVKTLENESKRICQSRKAQGLNDSTYHLYCWFYL